MGTRDWSKLDVSEATHFFIKESGFARMTPVQAIAIPLLLNHRDTAVEACTGSGKTLAFLIPAVEILMRSDAPPATTGFNVGCVALAPTRELAGQIHEVLGAYLEAVSKQDVAKGSKLGKTLMVGGSDAKAAAKSIQRASAQRQLQAVVATPGRLRAVMELAGPALNMKTLEILVLDEADRLLELGFSLDVHSILGAMPKQRRTGLFSATLTSGLQELMKTGMRNPVHVCVRRKDAKSQAPAEEPSADGKQAAPTAIVGGTRHEVPTKLQNFFVALPAPEKLRLLLRFLDSPEVRRGKTIVFFLTCACVDFFHSVLRAHLDAEPRASKKGKKGKGKKLLTPRSAGRVEKLHGQMAQNARTKAYEKFCQSSAEQGGILLSTDLASRGIDVESVNWIVQFDAPTDPNAFVHRIGRTARAGQSGQSLVMLLPHEDSYVPFLRQRGIPLEEMGESQGVTDDPSAKQGDIADAVLRKTRRLLETDRSVMLKGNKAYVSYIRAYQEHQLAYLFSFKSLDFGSLATGFCLLRMPRMKEILGRKVKNFQPSSVHPADVPFRDKKQEKLRQEKLRQEKQEDAGSELRQDEAVNAKAGKDAVAKQIEKERTRTEKRKAGRKGRADEWKMLQAEECLAKKTRKGRLTADDFAAGIRKAARKLDVSDEEGFSSDSEDLEQGERKTQKNGGSKSDKKELRWLQGRKRRRKKGKSGRKR